MPAGPPPAITQRVCSFSATDHTDNMDNQSTHHVILSEAKNLGSVLKQNASPKIAEMFRFAQHDKLCMTGHLRTELNIVLLISVIRVIRV